MRTIKQFEICPEYENPDQFLENWKERIYCRIAEEGLEFNSYDVRLLTPEEANGLLDNTILKEQYLLAAKEGKLVYVEINYET
jgi:hypothetical protein